MQLTHLGPSESLSLQGWLDRLFPRLESRWKR